MIAEMATAVSWLTASSCCVQQGLSRPRRCAIHVSSPGHSVHVSQDVVSIAINSMLNQSLSHAGKRTISLYYFETAVLITQSHAPLGQYIPESSRSPQLQKLCTDLRQSTCWPMTLRNLWRYTVAQHTTTQLTESIALHQVLWKLS